MKRADCSARASSAQQASRPSCRRNGRGGNEGDSTRGNCRDDCRGNRIFLYRVLNGLSRVSNVLYDRVTC
ncbi:hypothetical protein V1687_16840 [Pseudomonas putida]|uniref:hypothetical protein n=1 Tax=Pseudomonas putida TaxID=303 RepID=UPI002ED3FA74|nr:hypothetical protein V1687_16840 [Pseudomonas putida]